MKNQTFAKEFQLLVIHSIRGHRFLLKLFAKSTLFILFFSFSTFSQQTPVFDENIDYKIVAKHSGRVLDVIERSQDNGASIIQYDWSGEDNQRWKIKKLQDGSYTFLAKHSNKALTSALQGVNSNLPEIIVQMTGEEADYQRWLIEPTQFGYYKIKCKSNAMVIDIEGGERENAVKAILLDWNGGDNQQFQIVPVESQTTQPQTNPQGLSLVNLNNRGEFSFPDKDFITFKVDGNKFSLRFGKAILSSLIDNQPEQKIKYTKYNRLTAKWFKFKGIDVAKKQIRIGFRARYQKLEDRPWGGRFTVYDNAANIEIGVNLEIVDRKSKAKIKLRDYNTDWASGPLGWLESFGDGFTGVVTLFSSREFTTFSDLTKVFVIPSVNIVANNQLTFKCLGGKYESLNQNNILYLANTEYDTDGVWFVFNANSNPSQQDISKLIQLANNIANSSCN